MKIHKETKKGRGKEERRGVGEGIEASLTKLVSASRDKDVSLMNLPPAPVADVFVHGGERVN